MNRDPTNNECTRDPIFLLQVADRQWTQMPDGFEFDGETWIVDRREDIDEWVLPFVEWDEDDKDSGCLHMSEEMYAEAEIYENDNGWPMVFTTWRTESVFLTRKEGEDFAKSREHRYSKWRVYCIPCDGELAKILGAHSHEDKA